MWSFNKTYRVLVKGGEEFVFTFSWRNRLKRIQETTGRGKVRDVPVESTMAFRDGKQILGGKITIEVIESIVGKRRALLFYHYKEREYFSTTVVDFDSV